MDTFDEQQDFNYQSKFIANQYQHTNSLFNQANTYSYDLNNRPVNYQQSDHHLMSNNATLHHKISDTLDIYSGKLNF